MICIFTVLAFYFINFDLWEIMVDRGINQQWASFYGYSILALLIFIFHRTSIINSFISIKDRLKRPKFLLLNIILPMLISIVSTYLLVYAMATFFNLDILPQNNEMISNLADTLPLALTFIMMCVYAPLIEEIVFRECIIGWTEETYVRIIMIMVSVVIFDLIHVKSFVEFFYYLPFSIGLTYVYLKNNMEIASSITAHFFTNFLAFIGILIEFI